MPKILVLHPDPSQLDSIITKVNNLNKKSGPFDVLILLGNNIVNGSFTTESNSFDIPTYYTEGADSIDDTSRLEAVTHKNLNFMGPFSLFTTSDGVRLAFISGNEKFLEENYEDLQSKLQDKEVDLLITYQWSKVISNDQKLFLGDSKIDKFVRLLEPKYHFASGSLTGKFFESSPFQWEDGKVTRFISLGRYGGSEKWIYAFNLNNDSGVELPKNLIQNPFIEDEKRQRILEEENSKKRKLEEDSLLKSKRNVQPKIVSPEDCFFCLSNPKLQSHMIISIGEHAYLTIAKGPLTRPTDTMKFSGHCLIIPIAHIPCLEEQNEGESVIKTPLFNEILRYEISLVKLFASFKLGTVFFQINKSTSVHFHIQAFPIASDFLIDFEKVLNKNASLNNTKFKKNSKFDFNKFSNSEDEQYLQMINSKKDYVQFTTFDQSIQKQVIFISFIEEGKSFDLQFGRRVLAYLLQTPKRIKWDTCQQSQEREVLETESFKRNYEDYDFTLLA